jgi:cyclopropane fatty-acyl-phospholipid synthase-like methyltransferase
MSFTKKEIASYYNNTQNHYKRWWKLEDHLGLHYGIWEDHIRSFHESIVNTNKILLDKAFISANDHVLDAGCGVGGSSFYIHQQTNANVTGITLSEKQIALANDSKAKNKLGDDVSFMLMDYNNTSFGNEEFDVIWACESMCHTPDKTVFLNECYRLLKPGGKVILCDYFLRNETQNDPKELIKKWLSTWAISKIVALDTFEALVQKAGFRNFNSWDYSTNIYPSAKRMYLASIAGSIPSIAYNLTHPRVTSFAKTHFLSGYYQYKALRNNLWEYHVILLEK